MPTFPASLPQTPMLSGFSIAERETVLRSDTEIGPPLTRQRATAATTPIGLALKPLTLTQRETLRSFFRTDCKGGALTVTWAKLSDHSGGGTGTFLFVAPPDFAPLGRGLWRATLQMVRLP